MYSTLQSVLTLRQIEAGGQWFGAGARCSSHIRFPSHMTVACMARGLFLVDDKVPKCAGVQSSHVSGRVLTPGSIEAGVQCPSSMSFACTFTLYGLFLGVTCYHFALTMCRHPLAASY